MARLPLVAGNWKMNKTLPETDDFIERFFAVCPVSPACEIVILPPFTNLERAHRLLMGTGMLLGAQDVHEREDGAFTGAVSLPMLAACGCAFVLAGHSERRHLFAESDDLVNRKLHAIQRGGLRVILCVGETLDERRAAQTEAVLKRQLAGGLVGVQPSDLGRLVIAYEPVWAIGTGETATPKQAQEAIASIRRWIAGRFGADGANALRILYGGSVKPSNAADLQRQPDIDGALVGGASLDPEAFAQIITAVQSVQEEEARC